MKKILFALPAVMLFTYCSSSRKAATPPAGPGISNVNVISGRDTVKATGLASTPENRDWAYKSTHDTTLSGVWVLQGITMNDGTWSTTDAWYADTSAAAAANTSGMEATVSTTDQTTGTGTATTSKKTAAKTKASKSTLKATKSLQKYDSLMANTTYYTDSAINANIQPFKYWNRIPTVSLNPTAMVFSGNTGCNSMSGSFNFSGTDIRFGKNIVMSKMACNEYDESNFLNLLRKANSYTINNEGMLELKQGTTLLMTFRRQM